FPANVYNYGTAIPETVTPLTPKLADTRKGKIREAMENRFRAAAREDGVKTIMVRCGDFFGGTGTGSWFDLAIAKKLASGVFTAPGPETMMHAWAYMPDVAQTFVKLADLHGSLDTWSDLLFEGHTVTLHQMKEHLELIMGQNLKSSPLPWWLVRFVAPFNGMMRETLEMSYLWHRPHRLDGSELVSILGKVPRTPLREALKSAVEAQGTSTGKPLVSKPSELAIG
ncbi:MAG: oxidoreductase, partial [Pseudomonadota bacterium]